MSDTIILPVLARHFKDANFWNCAKCPISNAAKEYFGAGDVYEDINELLIWKRRYTHRPHTSYTHKKYKALASAAGYDDTIIFNLELKEVV